MSEPPKLKADPERVGMVSVTGIYVRASLNGDWGSYDLVQLDRASLLAWLDGYGPQPSTEEQKRRRAQGVWQGCG